ncbi:MAG: hypothetical protein E6K81_05245 [Candidatus Eisenbacteria bacterium]|uniref:Uncharacterized protein n=1 Tax=Eiseniibacteriota bacterium TaxID=2212470 RepID=A0A538UBN0_UNCEI|nr:MAG: hypothetical protein E6K81_05245 [Candidatus Eisenbacteria bacterium]
MSFTSTPPATRAEYCEPVSVPLSMSPRTGRPAPFRASRAAEMSVRVIVSSSNPIVCWAALMLDTMCEVVPSDGLK